MRPKASAANQICRSTIFSFSPAIASEGLSPFGHALSKRKLEIAFGCYLFIVGGRFVISLLSGQ